eukprot:gnl/MRDRNA2_/MRDRNA2_84801_c0_seq1.p1 gnl/MRDRNA2_/MRDRNA2_84801_c0~~gnl/MRDRNA2_/MRDRNA2_84801_c0_seq1.p1  ORF type:complete len:917 (+),score=181.98 gnl/MRDRNA2_/MRDRNA2_84801_c0_seq1:90-2840(+)
MGQTASRAEQGARTAGTAGFVVGGAVGAVPGAIAGGVATGVLYGTDAVLLGAGVGGGIIGMPMGALVAAPCAVVGAALGVMGGAAEDMTQGAISLGHAANAALEEARQGRERTSHRNTKSCQVAQVPSEALPLICALLVALQLKKMWRDEATNRAAAFAATCHEEEPKAQLLARAEAAGRKVLTYVKLSQVYPWEMREVTEAAAEQLVDATDPDVIDAAWILCGAKSLEQWSPQIRDALPRKSKDISPRFLLEALEFKYRQEKDNIVDALQRHFPGGPNRDAYAETVNAMWGTLSKPSFWKAHMMVQQSRLPQQAQRLTFQHLASPEFWATAQNFLASSSALCAHQGSTSEGSSSEGPGAMMLRSDSFEPRLMAAVRSQKMLGGTGTPIEQRIQVEILTAENLGSAEYRVGDFTTSLFGGKQKLSPYVEVKYGLEQAQTRMLQGQSSGQLHFGEVLSFPCRSNHRDGQILEFSIFDARGVQAMVRGDPMIGKASLEIAEDAFSGSAQRQTLQLLRDGEEKGTLTVRVGVLAPQIAYTALQGSKDRPLAEVALAMAQVLSQPHGVDVLLEAMPRPSRSSQGPDEVELRRTLKAWIIRLKVAAERSQDFDDEVALKHIARMARSAQQILAAVNEDLDGDEVIMLTASWVRQVFMQCTPNGQTPNLDEARLLRLLEAGRSSDGDPLETLTKYGVALPEGTSEEIVVAVANRLLEAERCEEEEIFTGVQIVEHGVVAQGIAAVTQLGQRGHVHVFLYDMESIQKWQRERGSDPNTRQHIGASDILVLTHPRQLHHSGPPSVQHQAFIHQSLSHNIAPAPPPFPGPPLNIHSQQQQQFTPMEHQDIHNGYPHVVPSSPVVPGLPFNIRGQQQQQHFIPMQHQDLRNGYPHVVPSSPMPPGPLIPQMRHLQQQQHIHVMPHS